MRQKVRLRVEEQLEAAKFQAHETLRDLKNFLNSQPLKVRVKMAWKVLIGRF